jgi:hypothetical protein
MKRRRGKVAEVSDTLEQVYLEGGEISTQAGIVVSKDGIVMFEHSHGPVSHKRYTVKYEINFCDIADILLVDPHEYTDLPRSKIELGTLFEPKNCHLLRIYFRPKVSHVKCKVNLQLTYNEINFCIVCEIRTSNLSRRHHQIISEWESYLRRASLAFDNKCIESDITAAEIYYLEILHSLQHATSNDEKIDILHELATECMMDFTLKKVCFSSREIFVVLFEMYDEILTPPSKHDYISYRVEHVSQTAYSPALHRTRSYSEYTEQNPHGSEHEQIKKRYIEHSILSRLKLGHAILKVNTYLLFMSYNYSIFLMLWCCIHVYCIYSRLLHSLLF